MEELLTRNVIKTARREREALDLEHLVEVSNYRVVGADLPTERFFARGKQTDCKQLARMWMQNYDQTLARALSVRYYYLANGLLSLVCYQWSN